MAPILYKKDISPPSRAVLMTAKAIDMELEFKDVDMAAGEHLEEEFVEKNPQHTIPMLEDEDFTLVDSSAIMIYMVTKYGSEDNADLYPEDPELRAQVLHRLFFNCGTLQSLIGQIVGPFFFEGKTTVEGKLVDKVVNAYTLLEKFLGDRDWMAGDSTTIADIALIASATSLNVLVPMEDACPKVLDWIARMEELPYYEANATGLDDFKAMHERALADAAE